MSECWIVASSDLYSELLVDQLTLEGIKANTIGSQLNRLAQMSSNPELSLVLLDVDNLRHHDLEPIRAMVAAVRPSLQLITLATAVSEIPEGLRRLSNGILKKPIPMKELSRIVKSHMPRV
jgi:DNA-binding response OmpR family regulator